MKPPMDAVNRFFAAWYCLTCCAAGASGLTLADGGKTPYVIVLDPTATPTEHTAATELADHLKQVTGAEFPIRATATGPAIRIAAATGGDAASLGADGILIRTQGDDLLLSGGQPRGVLYAVETFLEDEVGVRWWTSTETSIPHRPHLDIKDLNVRYVPKFRYREAYNWDVTGRHAVQAVHLKLDGHMTATPPEWGGHESIVGWCHTSFQFIPPGKYFAAHPEWFAQLKGHRQAGSQLCLSNEEMRQELEKNARAALERNPTARIISVSQNDTFGPCQCDQCRAIVREEGSESGPWIRFVNKVADDLCKDHPDLLIETLAYQYTRRPPKLARPGPHVIVRLCSIEANFSQPLSAPANADFGNDLRGWAKIAPNLFVWNYVTNFSDFLVPHPNLESLGPDLRFFADNHVVGVFEQGDDYNQTAGDFLPLRTWVQAHLLWDPTRDERALVKEFCDGYYGPAGPLILRYLDLVNAPVRSGKYSVGCFYPHASFFTADMLDQATALFDAAEAAVAADPQLTRRVKRERLAIDLLHLQRWSLPAGEDPQAALADYEARAKAYVDAATQAGARRLSEGQTFASFGRALISRARRLIPATLPKPGDALPPGAADVQESAFDLHGVSQGWSKLVDDPKASDGRAAFMPGTHAQWAVQSRVPASLAGHGPWRCYVVARIVPNAGPRPGGAAASLGVHDTAAGEIMRDNIGWATARDGEYHAYGIFLDDLRPTEYFWVAPTGDGKADGIYVDRIYIEKAAK